MAVGGETIGGTACHNGGIVLRIQQELLRGGPDIHTVVGNINGHITDDADTLFFGVVANGLPLHSEFILCPPPKTHFGIKFRLVSQSLAIISMFRSPIGPRTEIVVDLQRHKQSVIFQPRGMLTEEGLVGPIRDKPGIGKTQNGIAGMEKPTVIYPLAGMPLGRKLLLGQ